MLGVRNRLLSSDCEASGPSAIPAETGFATTGCGHSQPPHAPNSHQGISSALFVVVERVPRYCAEAANKIYSRGITPTWPQCEIASFLRRRTTYNKPSDLAP